MYNNRVYVVDAKENWVCDRFAHEWLQNNTRISTRNIEDASTIWLLAGWRWNHISPDLLSKKKVVVTVHHIVPDKFDAEKKNVFKLRDQFVDLYHVPCQKTKDQIKKLTKKPIEVIPFWVNQNIWRPIEGKSELRKKYGIYEDVFLVGSFQRDTEGSDLISPKLEKGPDLFCDAVEKMSEEKKKEGKSLRVLLAGWRRQYVMARLHDAGIPYYYSELPSFEVLNELYNTLDLYIVASRYEGGPQSIVECAATKTPIISTDVGLASNFLAKESIFKPGKSGNAVVNTELPLENISKILMPEGFEAFRKMFDFVHAL